MDYQLRPNSTAKIGGASDNRIIDTTSSTNNTTNNITGAATKSPREYTPELVQELLSAGYICVHPALWDHIPNGAHIRYVKKPGPGKQLPQYKRFKPGGFIKSHFESKGKKMLMIETKPGGRQGQHGYINFPIAYEDIEELWKKYDRDAFIEIHLIYSSLAQKKKQIEELMARVDALERGKK